MEHKIVQLRGVSTTGTLAIGLSAFISSGPANFAPLVLQAIVEQVEPVPDGTLVRTLEPAWVAILSALMQDPNALSRLSSRQLEELIAASYDKAGFDEVILTPRSGDYGRDVIAIRKGWGSVRIIDQVKAYAPGHVVTANDVRALLGVLSSDRAATKGIVTTTSTFAPKLHEDPFIAPYIPFRLELIDGSALSERILNLRDPAGASSGV